MQAFRIRRARPADLDDLLALEHASFTTDLLSRERMRHWIGAPNGILLVAEATGAAKRTFGSGVLGYVLVFTRRDSRIARIYSLAVAASTRGQGLGRRLLLGAARTSRELGCSAMKLEVAVRNAAAIGLYEKLGFVTVARLPRYYENGEHALRMLKEPL